MPTLQALMLVWSWLMSDWTHPIVAMAGVAALTPTPAPGTIWSKLYRVIDVIALNVLHAKSTGITPVVIAQQVATLLQANLQQKVGSQAVAPEPIMNRPPVAPVAQPTPKE